MSDTSAVRHDELRVALTSAVVEYCTREGLMPELQTAIGLARKHFELSDVPTVQLEQDPELDSDYLVLELRIQGHTPEIVAAHKRFAREWATTVPWPKSERIRLTYDILT